ncbi:hypothetical protein GCM10009838_40290 [Catenulispora subtropica]|uniref:Uncharacterized protein n=1 Tax=Catenulispora subtropica TaxID=450798 RepID=A0ABN2RW74_9ACTN
MGCVVEEFDAGEAYGWLADDQDCGGVCQFGLDLRVGGSGGEGSDSCLGEEGVGGVRPEYERNVPRRGYAASARSASWALNAL